MSGKAQNRLKQTRRELANAKRQLAEIQNAVATGNPPPQQALAVIQQMSMTHSGPTPAPWILQAYEEIDPGRAAKLFDLAETQAHHRMALENRVTGSDIYRSWCGLAAASAISLSGMGLAGYALYLGHAWIAGSIVAAVVAADLSAFIYGKRSQAHERQGRAETLGKRKNRD